MINSMTPSTMQVPRFVGHGRIEFVKKSVPEPGRGQLLIRVQANALCGSERGQFVNGAEVTPGHEAAGVVVAVGHEVVNDPSRIPPRWTAFREPLDRGAEWPSM
jgi:threonine 3-dehydrogenase